MKRRRRLGLRSRAGLVICAALVATALVGVVPAAFGGHVTGAGFTTINPDQDSGVVCLNGNPLINCNIYTGKSFVWLNGGPDPAYVGDGDYFFAVLAPGGQHDPRDGSANNLSDKTADPWLGGETNSDGSTVPSGDTYQNRTFTVSTDGDGNKVISYTGNIENVDPADDEIPHDFANNKIRLMPYDDTPNNGGVYIMAICSLKDGGYAAVTPSNCKYDAFKVQAGETTVPEAEAPTVTKDAAGSYKTTWTWDEAKAVDKTLVEQVGGTATFTYTLTATHSPGTNSGIEVAGNITVTNPNAESVEVNVSDALSDSTPPCTVKDGTTTVLATDDVTVPGTNGAGQKGLSYSCSINGSTVPNNLTNTVSMTWLEQILDDGKHLDASSSAVTYTYPNDGLSYIAFAQTKVDDCATLTDTFNGTPTTLGLACVDGSFTKNGGNNLWTSSQNLTPYNAGTRTFTFIYSRSITVPQFGCVSRTNTATFVTDDTSAIDGTPDDNTRTVRVCGPANTGALTMGFWKQTNGQNLLKTSAYVCPSGKMSLADYLKSLGPNATGPFSNAAGCDLSGYVFNIINGANAVNMNTMLKAQMLATALDVYFSDPSKGWVAAGSKTKTPGNFMTIQNLGSFSMDTTSICPMVDNLTAGTATCKNANPSTNAVTAGALPSSPMTVQQILDFAARVDSSTPLWDLGAYAGSNVWYFNTTTNAQDRTKQEVLKNVFDQINNNLAFAP